MSRGSRPMVDGDGLDGGVDSGWDGCRGAGTGHTPAIDHRRTTGQGAACTSSGAQGVGEMWRA